MCARFTAKFTEKLLRQLGLLEPLAEYRDRYNIAPSASVMIGRGVDGGLSAALATWGLSPRWMDAPKFAPINARAESLSTSGMFRRALAQGRCIIPASGFYEWQKAGEMKRPWYITRADGELLCFAGLWEPGESGGTFTIITTEANAFMAGIHERMPAILEPESISRWLASPDMDLLAPAAEGVLTGHRVGNRVGNPRNDDPGLIEPVGEDDRGLFGQE